MSATPRSIFAAAGASLVLAPIAQNASAEALGGSVADEVVELIRGSARANTALMRGDIDGYRAVIQHTDDYTLMSPFGGIPTRGSDMTEEDWKAVGRFFRHGTFEQEVVQSYGVADMVVLAVIERCLVEAGGLPPQEWPLRVTLVYRREGGVWRLAHRHADPLVKGVSLEQAAAIARGVAP